ncbi:porin [Paraburkholderia sp. BCC1884]|uniref:porin n=1 Tax=Paraburkholderia sp. BCC1884 TaxID=2562668 RepID=UPI00391F11F3
MNNKKYWLISALGILAGVAHAQSSVTLYGSIDEGLESSADNQTVARVGICTSF